MSLAYNFVAHAAAGLGAGADDVGPARTGAGLLPGDADPGLVDGHRLHAHGRRQRGGGHAGAGGRLPGGAGAAALLHALRRPGLRGDGAAGQPGRHGAAGAGAADGAGRAHPPPGWCVATGRR
ncbi:MAG: hypothetical protein MZU91_12555 [Desulfosudis oleivorans]|nr:hypothetical protein [Desulfosudis oleivorans]